MARKLFFLFVLLRCASLYSQAPSKRMVSPEVLPDHRVTFRLRAPKAAEVTVSGDFSLEQNGVIPMIKGEDGVWSLTTGPLPSDLYSYSYKVDGVPLPDPADPLTKPGVAETQSAFFVPGAQASLLQAAQVPHGEVRTIYYRSAVADATRRMHLYLPPGYEHGKARYPVLYLLHGGGDDDSTWVDVGRVNFALDNLIAQGKAQPMIVVMPSLWILEPPLLPEQKARNEELFARALREDVLPYVQSHYRVLPGPEHRALGGLGDGRNFLPTLTWKTLGDFGSLLFVSGGADKERFSQLQASFPGVIERPANAARLHFYIGNGTHDASFVGAQSFAAELKTLGYRVHFFQSENTHGWPEFRYNFQQFAALAFR